MRVVLFNSKKRASIVSIDCAREGASTGATHVRLLEMVRLQLNFYSPPSFSLSYLKKKT